MDFHVWQPVWSMYETENWVYNKVGFGVIVKQ